MSRHLLSRLKYFLPILFFTAIGVGFFQFTWDAIELAVITMLLAYLAIEKLEKGKLQEYHLRSLFEHANVGMAINDKEKRWQYANPALCKMLGYSAEQLAQKTWQEITHPDDQASSDALFNRLMRGEIDRYDQERRYLRQDGSVVHVAMAVQAVKKNGRIDFLFAILDDMTSRIKAEKALLRSEEHFHSISDNLPNSYVYQCSQNHDTQLKFTYISSGVRQIHGYEPEQVINDSQLLFQDVDPEQANELNTAILESARTLNDFSIELRVRMVGDRWGWLQILSRPRRSSSGEVTWDGIATDITATRDALDIIDLQARRSDAMLALPRQSEGLEEATFMQHAIGVIEKITDSRIGFIHFVNPDGESIDLVTWSPNTLQHYCTASFDRHYPVSEAGLWADAIREKRPLIINDYASAPNKRGLPSGHSTLIRLACVPVMEMDRVRLIAGVGNKATPYTNTELETIQMLANETWRLIHQQRAERTLQVSMQVVNASSVVCFRWRAAEGWPVVFVSDNVARWGYTVDEMLRGTPSFAEMVHPDDLSRVADEVSRYTAEGRADFVQEYRLLTADKQIIWVSDRTNVIRNEQGEVEFYDGVLHDITESKQHSEALSANLATQQQLNKRLEEAHNQLLQSEKMASIGQLAAGVAHELNNPIGFVHSNLGTLESYLRDLMEIVDAYGQVADQTIPRADVDRLKEQRDFDFMRTDIFQLLSESKEGLGRVRKIVQDLKSFSHVSEQEWQWADLSQGLDSTLNIVWNELKYKCKVVKDYGEIPKVYCLISQLNQVFMNLLVNASHAIETQGTITLRTRLNGTDRVNIEICDTGKGIAPENLTRIFEPFFTTKPIGKGTGLGLSLSYGIVDKHGGRIEVESRLGVGSTFRVILPIQPDSGSAHENATENFS